eukprot:CAMPEP_0201283364 /NCGR_PEP_ID=MMETSP1317-20130820/8361_1 /ASSEMBLY_ACC=CAM_ASM_000770 /TAXON_ID=187299 /ORGANISM="Undescribed Undescribed, Strain Undescribed" /LENGTH=436 /DNA_ID=CAMNT_0047599371 /DNA_START=267 /DNA_END=1577 /DNA_ORIENTATION=-
MLAKEVTLSVWTRAAETEKWRGLAAVEAAKDLNAELKREGKDITVKIDLAQSNPSWGDYKKKFTMACEAGKGPDIVLSGHEDVPIFGGTGKVVPIANSVSQIKGMAKEFDDVIEGLWSMAMWKGKIWAIPQDTECRPMYYSKSKLKELGWSNSKIENLPNEIRDGKFTLDDMIETAKEAIKKGVIKKGYGYWHRPRKGGDYMQYYVAFGGKMYDAKEDKLVVDKDALLKWYEFQRKCVEQGVTPENYIGTEWSIWHNTVSGNEALFWNGGIWQWSEWIPRVEDKGGEPYMFKNFGYALQPSGIRGKKASQLSHPLVYFVVSEKASGKKNQDLATRLLEKMTTKELNTNHAVGSSHLGILKSQVAYPAYKKSKILSDALYMLDYAFYQPNHPYFSMYFDAVFKYMEESENGKLSPKKAVKKAVRVLKAEIGDQLIVQ